MTSPIAQLFNRIAPTYDQLNHQLSWGLDWVWKQMAVDWAGLASPALDLCCGSGDLAFLWARALGPTGQVWGVDFAAAQLKIARRRFPQLQKRLTWVEADACQLPFGNDTFAAATMGYGWRNIPDRLGSLLELKRVLQPGAKAAILDFHLPFEPPLRAFQDWYLSQVVVPTAQALGLEPEYVYLRTSLADFPQGPEQVSLAHQAGFVAATHHQIAAGMMGVLVVQKPVILGENSPP